MTVTQQSEGDVRELDLFAPHLIHDPYNWYARIREEGPLPYSPPGMPHLRIILLSHYADVHAVLRDPRFGRAGFREAVAKSMGDGPLAETYSLWFLFKDPPDHSRLRVLVSKAFTPRAVDNLRRSIEDVIERLLDVQRGKASFDLMSTFAYQVPVLVICELLGVPEADRGRFADWSAAVAKGLDIVVIPDAEALRLGNEGAAGLTASFASSSRCAERSQGTTC